MDIIKTSYNFWGILEGDKVFCCIDQTTRILSLEEFKKLCSVESDNNLKIMKIKDCFPNDKGTEESLYFYAKLNLERAKPFFNKMYWANSFSFVRQMVLPGMHLAIVDMPITNTFKNKLESSNSNEVGSIYSFLDKEIFAQKNCKFAEIKNYLFNILKVKVGDQIVTYSEPVFISLFGNDNSYLSKYQPLFEMHALVISEDEVIIEDRFSGNYKRVSIEVFLRADLLSESYRKPYLFQNTGIDNHEVMKERLPYCLDNIKDFKKFVAYIQTGNIRAVPKGFYSTINRSKNRSDAKNQSDRLYETLREKEKNTESKISIQDLALAINRPRQTVYNWVNGINTQKEIKTDLMLSIAKYLGATPHWLVLGDNFPHFIPTKHNTDLEIKDFMATISDIRTSFFMANHEQKTLDLLSECDKVLKNQISSMLDTEIDLLSYEDFCKGGLYNKESSYIYSSIISVDPDNNVLFEKEKNGRKTLLSTDFNNKKIVYLHNQDNHLSPRIEENDYLLVNTDYKYDSILKNTKTSSAIVVLGMFVLRMGNVVINAEVKFDALLQVISLHFTNDEELKFKADYIPGKNFSELNFYSYTAGDKSSSSYTINMVGQILQVVKYYY